MKKNKFKQELRKSISNEIGNLNNLSFNKTGLEIKQNLNRFLNEENIKKENYLIQLNNLLEIIKEFPNKEINKYYLKNIDYDICKLPKKFQLNDGFDCIAKRNPMVLNNFLSKNEEENNLNKLKINYNNLVDEFIDSLVEINYINTFISNLKDDCLYMLTPNQLIIFGF